jgi:AcrR family transcriptional regulator
MKNHTEDKPLNYEQEIKRKILETAKVLFLKHGYEAVTIKKIAEQLNISPTTIYLYYEDKSDMMYILHQTGFNILSAQFEPLKAIADPVERLRVMGQQYIKFAVENPDFYEIIFIMRHPIAFITVDDDNAWQGGRNAFNHLLAAVADCMEKGCFQQTGLHRTALFIWSAIHGICSLKLQGHFEHVVNFRFPEENPKEMFDGTFDTLTEVIKAIK